MLAARLSPFLAPLQDKAVQLPGGRDALMPLTKVLSADTARSCARRGRQIWPDILSQILLCGWERLLAVGSLLRLEATTRSGDASQQIQLQSGQMLSALGSAPSAPGRGWRENRETALEEYGQK